MPSGENCAAAVPGLRPTPSSRAERATSPSIRCARGRAARRRPARLPDDVDGLGALLREAVGEQVGRGARLRARRRVVGRPVAGQRGGAERGDETDHPRGQHDAAAAEHHVGQPREAAGRGEGSGDTGRTSSVAARTIASANVTLLELTCQAFCGKLSRRRATRLEGEVGDQITDPVRFGAFYGMLVTEWRISERLDAELQAATGISLNRLELLLHLHFKDGRRRMSDLADALLLSRGGATRLVARAEDDGLVRREIPPDDRRATYAVLTRRGARGGRARLPGLHRAGAAALPGLRRRRRGRGARARLEPRARGQRDGLRADRARRRRARGALSAQSTGVGGACDRQAAGRVRLVVSQPTEIVFATALTCQLRWPPTIGSITLIQSGFGAPLSSKPLP